MINALASPAVRRPVLPGGRPFGLLLSGLAVSSLGDWLYNVALLALVFTRTGSATWVALATAGRVLPIVVLGPIGGVIADRVDRRRLMISSDLVRAVLMVALATVAALGLPIVLAPVLAALATAAGSVTPPCVAASTARLVAEDELQRASALRAGIGQAAIVAGPAAGALVLVVAGPALAIALNAISFLLSALAIASIGAGRAFAPADRDATGPLPSVLADVRIGARALRGAPTAVRLICADVLCSAVYGVLSVTLVLLGHRLGAGGSGYGLLLGAFGAGGIVGAAVSGRLDTPSLWRRTLAVALLLVVLTLLVLASAPSLLEALCAAGIGGGGMVVGEVLSETALPRMLDGEVLGRAYGLVVPASVIGIVVGSLIAGPLVSLLGLSGALAATAVAVLVGGGVLVRRPLAPPAPATRLAVGS